MKQATLRAWYEAKHPRLLSLTWLDDFGVEVIVYKRKTTRSIRFMMLLSDAITFPLDWRSHCAEMIKMCRSSFNHPEFDVKSFPFNLK